MCPKVYRTNSLQTTACCCHCSPMCVNWCCLVFLSLIRLKSTICIQRTRLPLSSHPLKEGRINWDCSGSSVDGCHVKFITFNFSNGPYDSRYSLLAGMAFLLLPRTICTSPSQMAVGPDEPRTYVTMLMWEILARAGTWPSDSAPGLLSLFQPKHCWTEHRSEFLLPHSRDTHATEAQLPSWSRSNCHLWTPGTAWGKPSRSSQRWRDGSCPHRGSRHCTLKGRGSQLSVEDTLPTLRPTAGAREGHFRLLATWTSQLMASAPCRPTVGCQPAIQKNHW